MKKTGETKLYKFCILQNIFSKKELIFLLFENMDDFQKWKKIKSKKFIVKKIYKLKNKIQVNGEMGRHFIKTKYFAIQKGEMQEIGLMRAKQLNIDL